MEKIWNISTLLKWTEQYFRDKGIDSARIDAEMLLSHVLKTERIYLYAHYDRPMDQDELKAFRQLVQKRATRQSVAHILGHKEFMGLDFTVNESVLIPRPDTEILVETVLAEVSKELPLRILDIGTGSGAIILSLLHYLTAASAVGVDISPQALHTAQKNALALALQNRITFTESDMFTHVGEQSFQVLVSNPPYLTAEDMENLEPEVRYDPKLALAGGPDGLYFYGKLIANGWQYVDNDGLLAFEVGMGQALAVAAMAEKSGHYDVMRIVKDYNDLERVVLLRCRK